MVMNLGSNSNNEREQFAFDLNVKPVEEDNSDFPEDADLCTICIEPLVNTRDDRRTFVTLTCGHKFHLDCIGSAFNAKGFMECPNCKQTEPGQWRYASGPPVPIISESEWFAEDEEDDSNSDRVQPTSVTSSVGPYFSNLRYPARWGVQRRAPPHFSRALEPGVMPWRNNLPHPSFHHTPSVRNAPLFPLPYPNTSAVPVDRIPPLFGDLSAPVSGGGHMFSSGTEEVAGGISLTYVRRPWGFPSSSRAGGTSVNDGDSIGASSSNGGRGGGGNGDRNGISGGSHLRDCRPS